MVSYIHEALQHILCTLQMYIYLLKLEILPHVVIFSSENKSNMMAPITLLVDRVALVRP